MGLSWLWRGEGVMRDKAEEEEGTVGLSWLWRREWERVRDIER